MTSGRTYFSTLIDADESEIVEGPKNAELYFEEGNLDAFLGRLATLDLNYVHELREQPWGQRVLRLYDPDLHIVEVGEPMESVAKRLFASGLSIEEVAGRTMMPVEFVRQLA